MRVLAVAMLVSLAWAQPIGSPEYSQKLIRFHNAYNKFFRDYFGCPQEAIDFSQCNPSAGTTDYGEYLKAAKLAKEAFPR